MLDQRTAVASGNTVLFRQVCCLGRNMSEVGEKWWRRMVVPLE